MTTETEQPVSEPTSVPFKAEVKQVLHILAHSLYTDREIFLRELISNASDALYRVQFEMLTNAEVLDPEAELAIRIEFDEQARTISISDSGIGMTREELIENLGTIAQSGARALLQRLEAQQRSEIIGQFGVGFYSAFVVADELRVVSRSYRPDAQAAEWRSSGDETFTVAPAERAERGTTVTLHLKEDAVEFANDWRLKQIIKRHSNFVAFPIYVGEVRANQQTALWRQSPRQVEPEQYNEFYRQLTLDTEDPLLHLHLSTEAPSDLHTILFIPAHRERGMIERRIEGRIKLYSRKILIQEDNKDLLPSYYRFIEGVVDSEDLPLNVSRETVQGSQIIARIRKTLTSRVTKELVELAQKDPETYAKFWKELGIFLKEGVASDYGARTELLPLLRFHTSRSEGALVSLADYKGRIAEGQEEIYYLIAPDLERGLHSPHLEAFSERGFEVLILNEMIDSFLVSALREYEGLSLHNVDDPDLQLPGQQQEAGEEIAQESFDRLVERIRQVLGERVQEVRASSLLRSSPVRLVAADGSPNRELERIQRMLHQDFSAPPQILELNRSNALVASLARLLDQRPDDPLVGPLVEQLYDSALLLEGLHPNPGEMAGRLQLVMEAALRGAGAPQERKQRKGKAAAAGAQEQSEAAGAGGHDGETEGAPRKARKSRKSETEG